MNLNFEKIKVYYDGGDNPFEEGKVVVEPLERGIAQRLGNFLRAIMLSSMPGPSVIGVKIPDVYHELDEIPFSVTDMPELILRLKKIRFNLVNDTEEIQVIRFKADKEGAYTANDLILPEGVEIQNKDQELLQLTGTGLLEFEVYVKNSRGYVDSNFHTEFEERPDIIAVDGVFSPIVKVGHKKENIRLGQNTNYERLTMTITTDGSIHPKDATMLAAKILNSFTSFFENMSDIAEKTEIYQEKQEEENRLLSYSLEQLDLSVRAYNCLKRDGYTTVRKILTLSEMQLGNINQMGEKSVKEVIAKMKELGFELRKD